MQKRDAGSVLDGAFESEVMGLLIWKVAAGAMVLCALWWAVTSRDLEVIMAGLVFAGACAGLVWLVSRLHESARKSETELLSDELRQILADDGG